MWKTNFNTRKSRLKKYCMGERKRTGNLKRALESLTDELHH